MSIGIRRSVLHDADASPDARVRRRQFVFAVATAAFAASCGSKQNGGSLRPSDDLTTTKLWSFFDLPADDPRSRELSGVAWDAAQGVLWAVHDESPSIVALIPDRDLRAWRFGDTIEIDAAEANDLEGLVVVEGGFIVCSEEGPRVIEVDRKGRFRREIALPPRLREARTNKSLESLTISPSGRYLFTTTEAALERDGSKATDQIGTRVRLVRLDLRTGDLSEHTYETDPVPYNRGDWGVADLAAFSDTELFVLERGWSTGHGNNARIYQTSLDARASCLGVDELPSDSPALAKALRVDLSKVAASGLPAPRQPQPTPLLDNYEGITLGPRMPNGRPSLLMVSDDNGNANQFARILVLGI